MKKSSYQIPFIVDHNGITMLMTFPWGDKIIWRDNYEFQEDMQILDYGRGRSSITFTFKSQKDGSVYHMFVSDLMKVIEKCEIKNGMVLGQKWTFIKKGANYGLQLCGEK